MKPQIAAMGATLVVLSRLGEVDEKKLEKLTYIAVRALGVNTDGTLQEGRLHSPAISYGIDIALTTGFAEMRGERLIGLTKAGKKTLRLYSRVGNWKRVAKLAETMRKHSDEELDGIITLLSTKRPERSNKVGDCLGTRS